MSLIKCSECGKEISKKADKCPNCGAPVRSQLNFTPFIAILVIVLLAWGLTSFGGGDSDSNYSVDAPADIADSSDIAIGTLRPVETEQDEPAAPVYDLKQVGKWSWSFSSTRHFVTAKGRIKNIGNSKLENVEALVEWTDKDGNLIKSQASLIEYNPIMPGQTSPWEVTVSANPAMEHGSLRFKNLMGGSYSTDY